MKHLFSYPSQESAEQAEKSVQDLHQGTVEDLPMCWFLQIETTAPLDETAQRLIAERLQPKPMSYFFNHQEER